MKSSIRNSILFLFFIFIGKIHAQPVHFAGIPFVKHYTFNDYKASPQIWDIDEAPNHILYFANLNGLMEYDGLEWRIYSGSKGITRSVAVANNEKIYTGSDDDFGQWTKTADGKWQYKSLYPLRDKVGHPQEEFWNCLVHNEQVIFQSVHNLYILNNKMVTRIPAPNSFTGIYKSGNIIFVTDYLSGIYTFDGSTLQKVPTQQSLEGFDIIGVSGNTQSMIIATRDKGLYSIQNGVVSPLTSPASEFIQKNTLFSFYEINSQTFALGTIADGIIISDRNGKIITHINKSKGLQNNTLLSMTATSFGKLWLGLDNGIDTFSIESPVSFFYDYRGEFGTAYDAIIWNQYLYVGTNQGLYRTSIETISNPLSINNYELLNDSHGQVWTLEEVQGEMLCGHNNGLFKINDTQMTKIDSERVVWSIKLWDENHLLTGNYNGVYVYEKQDGTWKKIKKIADFPDSSNQLLVDSQNNTLWVKSSNLSVFRLKLDKNFNVLDKKNFWALPQEMKSFYIDLKGNELVAKTPFGTYKPNEKEGKFQKVSDEYFPVELRDNVVKDYYSAAHINSQYYFYPIYNGFALYDVTKKNNPIELTKPLVRKVNAFGNEKSILINEDQKIKYRNNNLRFYFTIPNADASVEYQYQLKGFSDKWSALSPKTEAEFLNLSEGKYELHVKAFYRGKYSPEEVFTFSIAPPWYRSILAYILWIGLILAVIYFVRKVHHNRLNRKVSQLLRRKERDLEEQAKKHELELMYQKQQNSELDKKRLEELLETKELELAQKALIQKQNNETIQKIKSKIVQLQEKANVKIPARMYQELLQYIDKKGNDNANKEFEIAFDNSQLKFHENLLKAYPDLTNKDLLLCSYLKMNMTSKQIADITGLLSSSIDVNRSRLRKKMGLSKDDSISDFLRGFSE